MISSPSQNHADSGRVLRPAAFVLALVIAGALLLWWRISDGHLSTDDAILFLPESSAQNAADPFSQTGTEPVALPSPLPAPDASEALRLARMEFDMLGEEMMAARQAIEEAVVMVREQKENFDFANDRYEKLMPLVETGALEPLAASQIQSAYISARASLAQAKFLLSEARREYGSETRRRWRFERAEMAVREASALAAPPMPTPPAEEKPRSEPPDAPCEIRAVFRAAANRSTKVGDAAVVTLPALPGKSFPARVISVLPGLGADGAPELRVLLAMQPPSANFQRTVLPCRVAIPVTTPGRPAP